MKFVFRMPHMNPKVAFWFWLFVSGFVGGLLHEVGHYIAGLLFGLEPTLAFQSGGTVDYKVPPQGLIEVGALMAGPVFTWITALFSFFLHKSFKWIGFLSFALWNGLFRLSVLIDGQRSDEGKTSTLLGTPFLFEGIAVGISLGLCVWFLRHQKIVSSNLRWLPVYFIVAGLGFRLSFDLFALF